jgi:hypothetical protein
MPLPPALCGATMAESCRARETEAVMEAWSWIVVIIALLLLVAGTLRFDVLSAAWHERFGGRRSTAEEPPRPLAPHGHGAAAHTGHVAPHGPARRRVASQRHDKRHPPA